MWDNVKFYDRCWFLHLRMRINAEPLVELRTSLEELGVGNPRDADIVHGHVWGTI